MHNRFPRIDEDATRITWYVVGVLGIIVSIVVSIYGILR
jgi:hypothetical protein